jgi:hypothetical protein
MAGLIPIGSIADPSKDPLPSTGAHLDPRVIPKFGPRAGKKINPEEARSLLQNVLVGPNQTPLVQQTKDGWKWNFPVTSKYGPRVAPTAGASTFHEGIDLAIPTGTQLTYKGYGSFKPERGYGVLSTTDAQGNPYDIQLLHTAPAKPASVGAVPNLTAVNTSDADKSRTEDILKAFLYGAQSKETKKERTLQDELKEQLLGSVISQALNPTSFLSSYNATDPYMSGFNTGSKDFFAGLLG